MPTHSVLLAAGELFKQVGCLLGGQARELSGGHQEQPRRFQRLDVPGRQDNLLVLGVAQHHHALVPA